MTVAEETVEGFKETEVGLLPKDWEVVRLESQLELIKNGITKTQNKESLGYPITRIETIADERIDMLKTGYVNNLNDSEIQRYKLEIEDILFSHINSEPHLGKTAIYKGIPPVLIHGMNLLMLRANKTTINAYYLNYLCNFYRGKGVFVGLAARAVGQSSINQGKLKALEIPLPPLPEQQKIAFVFSTIQEAKEKTENVIRATKELKKSMMKHLFTYGPVPVEDAERVSLKETEIGMIPEHWEVVRMGTIANVRTSFPSFREIEELNTNNNAHELILALKVSDMNIIGNEKYVTKSAISFRYDGNKIGKFLKPFSVFFPKRGGAIGTNKKRITKHYSILDPNLIGIESTKKINGAFLFSCMDKLDLKTLQDNTPIPQLNKHNVEDILLSLPPLPEHKPIADILSVIDNKIEAEENRKQALETLFKTLLSLLMTGKLRVKDVEIPI